jgi:hypothetical protein
MDLNIEKLDINASSSEIVDYLERFELWSLIHKDKKKEMQTAYFLTAIGKEAYALLKSLCFPDAPATLEYTKLKEIILRHFKPVNFEAAERAKFHSLVRSPNQSVRNFILTLQCQASKCNFQNQLEIALRDRIIAGINDQNIQRKLLLLPDATFQSVRNYCEQFEDVNTATSEQSTILANSSTQRSNVQQSFRKFDTNQKVQNRITVPKVGSCASCGLNHLRSSCRFRNAKCNKCGKIGHIARICRSRTLLVQKASEDSCDDQEVVNSLDDEFESLTLAASNSKHIYQELFTENGETHRFIIDTGSEESIIAESELRIFYPKYHLRPSNTIIRGVTGHELPLLGYCFIPIYRDNTGTVICKFLVTSSGLPILGLTNLRLLKIKFSLAADSASRHDMEKRILNLLDECSRCSGGMKIPEVNLEVSGDPVFCKRRILPYGLRESVKRELDSLVQNDILVPVSSSCWATPIVTPLKRDGCTPRICGDYRITLNKCLLQQSCTTLEPEDIMNRLSNSSFFSKIDLKNAFLQIPLDESSSCLTTITTPWGLYRYKFLPFGLSVSPSIFQHAIDSVIAGLEGVESYQDDLIIHGPEKSSHDLRLLRLLERLRDFNVTLNSSKCQLFVDRINCLGLLLDKDGIKPDPDRLSPLINAPSPRNFKELKSTLGAIQYYSKFIPNFARRADPLFVLMSEGSFEWSSNHEVCLRSLYNHLKSNIILTPFSPNLPSTLITDASNIGIGAVLEQQGKPVLFISRRLSVAERGYSQTLLEALAVWWAVNRLHKYLFNSKFTIVTDHQALKYIYDPGKSLSRNSTAMVQRWSIALGAYNYTIQHRNAKNIQHADFLSRYSKMDAPPITETECLLVQPLPVNRSELILETKKYFNSISIALSKGWNSSLKRKFPQFYSRREELSLTPDGILCLNDRIVIPPTLRTAVLNDLHSSHLGIDKMKSLARLTCWWPEINEDITQRAKNCSQCINKIVSKPSKWTPWPLSCESWQRIHADYCGPFLGKYYALIIIDSFSKWPEVFFTTNPNAEFTMQALRKTFSREGVPVALVTDNGTHFAASNLTQWLTSLGCKHLFTAPRHPQSNGLAENFVRTLKSAISSSDVSNFSELDKTVDNFLLQYRNACHASTKMSPANLFKNRTLRSNMRCIDSAEVTFQRGNDYRLAKGIILRNLGERMVQILDLSDASCHRRHVDQIRFNIQDQKPDMSLQSEFDESRTNADDMEERAAEESPGGNVADHDRPSGTNELRRSNRLIEECFRNPRGIKKPAVDVIIIHSIGLINSTFIGFEHSIKLQCSLS